MPSLRMLKLFTIVLVAVVMSAGFAHLLALPNKIDLAADDYLAVQQTYRGWALLGIVIFAAIGAALALAIRARHERYVFVRALATAVCLVISLVVFFAFTFPANQATHNWTMLPDDWQSLRRHWEYSHAVNALLYLCALVLATLAALPAGGDEPAAHERRRGITTPRSSAARTASS